MELKKLEDENKLILIDGSGSRIGFNTREEFFVPRPYTIEILLSEISKCIKAINAKRVVIDCLDTLDLDVEDSVELRKCLLKFATILKSFGCTVLMIENRLMNIKISRDDIQGFTADGIILLKRVKEKHIRTERRNFTSKNLTEEKSQVEVCKRKIEIAKMRGIVHSLEENIFEISENRICIQNEVNISK